MNNRTESYSALEESRRNIVSLLKQSRMVFLIFLFSLVGSAFGLSGWVVVVSFILAGAYVVWDENRNQSSIRTRYIHNQHLPHEQQLKEASILLGGVRRDTKLFTGNTLVVGAVGSGKSVTIKLIAKDALVGIGSSIDKRALIYDPSGEWPSILEAMGFSHQVVIYTNPLDRRCRPWWISKDIKTPSQVAALAKALIPIPLSVRDHYWLTAARDVMTVVIRYFNEVANEKWTLRDLLIAARNRELVSNMCANDPQLQRYLQISGSDKTVTSTISSIVSNTHRYERIAALWHKSETTYGNQPFSIGEWLNSSSILLISRPETTDEGLREINRIMFTSVIQLITEQPEKSHLSTWMFLNDIDSLAGCEVLLTSMTRLRKHGAAIVGGFKTLTHIVDEFGESIVNTMLSQFDNIAALRQTDFATEEWLRRIAGKQRIERAQSSNVQGRGKSETPDYIEVIDEGSLVNIPEFRPSLGKGMKGFYISGDEKWWHTYDSNIIQQLPPEGDSHQRFIRMSERYQELEPWTIDDWRRLNILNLQEDTLNPPTEKTVKEDDVISE